MHDSDWIVHYFTVLDYVLLAVMVFFVLRGIIRGGVSVLVGSLGFIAGFWLAFRYYLPLGRLINKLIPSWHYTMVIAFLIIFFMTWFSVGAVGHWIGRSLRKVGLGMVDRILGALIGVIIAIIIQSLLVTCLTLFLPAGHTIVKESRLAPYSLQGMSILYAYVPDEVKKELENRRRVLQEQWNERSKKQACCNYFKRGIS